ncbi:MAG: hypothetical protein CVU09_04000 [Bacteroidetes bacterium HGW-Bacteroidetes-4]|jgi:uncharacterized protein (TIGR02145 family)|nr:MAG: hypothetical protein CVU09_04000 [Bacteroidetes bacterium HGW-Bacteroidetes-4]
MDSLKDKLTLFLTIFVCTVMAQEPLFSTIRISDDVYFDETEIDVASWLSFYTWTIVHEGFGKAQKLMPDSNAIEPELWNYIKSKSTDFVSFEARYTQLPVGYFCNECTVDAELAERLPNFRNRCSILDFPITGISYEQAEAFCKWRTKTLGDNKIVFRLPTPEEWKYFAVNGLSESEKENGFRDSLSNKNCALFNYNIPSKNGNDENQGNLKGVAMYSPKTNGAYDVFGNVSEMTSLKGVAKGGNFTLYANQSHVDSIQSYTKPEIYLGFRCIAIKGSEPELADKEVITDVDAPEKFGNFTDSRDGKTYPTVLIGNQMWFAANLAFKPDSGKYWAWNNEERHVAQYGYLYTWEIAKEVCPIGWHLPSKEEFETLLINYDMNENVSYRELHITGSAGYSIIESGLRFGVNFSPTISGTAFWSSTQKKRNKIWGLGVDGLRKSIKLYDTYGMKTGLQIRCVKDNE